MMEDKDDSIVIDLGGTSLTYGSMDDYQIYTTTNTTPSYAINTNWADSINFDGIGSSRGLSVTEGDINISGDGDLMIGDRSMKEFMNKVEERLAILQPNEELEEQWEELKKLGNKYRKLEKQLLERNKIMEILKEK